MCGLLLCGVVDTLCSTGVLVVSSCFCSAGVSPRVWTSCFCWAIQADEPTTTTKKKKGNHWGKKENEKKGHTRGDDGFGFGWSGPFCR